MTPCSLSLTSRPTKALAATIGLMPPVAVVIPAYNEADRIAATVTAAFTLPGVDVVLVASDGSTDDTVGAASRAGATVWRTGRNRGKAAAMMAGAAAAIFKMFGAVTTVELLMIVSPA